MKSVSSDQQLTYIADSIEKEYGDKSPIKDVKINSSQKNLMKNIQDYEQYSKHMSFEKEYQPLKQTNYQLGKASQRSSGSRGPPEKKQPGSGIHNQTSSKTQKNQLSISNNSVEPITPQKLKEECIVQLEIKRPSTQQKTAKKANLAQNSQHSFGLSNHSNLTQRLNLKSQNHFHRQLKPAQKVENPSTKTPSKAQVTKNYVSNSVQQKNGLYHTSLTTYEFFDIICDD